jgi:hypothetical protein
MQDAAKVAEMLEARRAALAHRLSDDAPFAIADQKHTKANTPEWAYWHFGYCVALADAIRLLTNPPREGSEDRSTSAHLGDPGEARYPAERSHGTDDTPSQTPLGPLANKKP